MEVLCRALEVIHVIRSTCKYVVVVLVRYSAIAVVVVTAIHESAAEAMREWAPEARGLPACNIEASCT